MRREQSICNHLAMPTRAVDIDFAAHSDTTIWLRLARNCSPCSSRLKFRRTYSRRSEEHTSELQSPCNLVCRLLLEKKKTHVRAHLCRCCSPPPPCKIAWAILTTSTLYLSWRRSWRM